MSAKKYLVIVESPEKSKNIHGFLGSNYKVIATKGHVRDLPKSELGIDIENDFEPKYITIRGKGEILAQLRKEVKKADKVYLATDPDREGEAISWHLLYALKLDPEKTARVTFNEITKDVVKKSIKEAREMKELSKEYKVPFVINDNIEVALAVDADGVHIGQDDMSVEEARKLLGEDKIIGVSAHNVEEAIKAQKGGADYLGVGAVCATSTKKDANVVSKEEIKKICHTVEIPVVAIGGIKKENIKTLEGTDVDGVAVVSAIFAAKDIKKDTKQLRSLVEEMKQK